MLRRIIDRLLSPYYAVAGYLERAHYLEKVYHPVHGELMTRRLDRMLVTIHVALCLVGFVTGVTVAFLIGADATRTVTTVLPDALGMVHHVTLPSSEAAFIAVLFVLAGFLLGILLRAYVVHRVFRTTWGGRSFRMPVAPAFF